MLSLVCMRFIFQNALRVFMLYYVTDKYATIFRLVIYIFSRGPVEAAFFETGKKHLPKKKKAKFKILKMK
jgi:hypothetical protein